MAVLGPANLPPDVTQKLQAAFTAAARDPAVVKQLPIRASMRAACQAARSRRLIHDEIIKVAQGVDRGRIQPM